MDTPRTRTAVGPNDQGVQNGPVVAMQSPGLAQLQAGGVGLHHTRLSFHVRSEAVVAHEPTMSPLASERSVLRLGALERVTRAWDVLAPRLPWALGAAGLCWAAASASARSTLLKITVCTALRVQKGGEEGG